MAGVDPIYYIDQIIYFVIQAVFLGYVLSVLRVEIATQGYLAPRTLWFVSFCGMLVLSLIASLDPFCVLGLFVPNWLKFLESLLVQSIVLTVAIGAYVYAIAVYKYSMSSIPVKLRNLWIAICAAFFVIHVIICGVGAITNNLFVFGIDSIVLIVHENMLVVALNVNLWALRRGLLRLSRDMSANSIGNDSFNQPLKKIARLRRYTIFACTVINAYHIFSAVGRLSSTNAPITAPDPSKFTPSNLLSQCIHLLVCLLLIFMARRPSQKAESKSGSAGGSSTTSKTAAGRPSLTTRTATQVDLAGIEGNHRNAEMAPIENPTSPV